VLYSSISSLLWEGIRVDTSLNVATLRTSWQHAAHVGRQQILYNATSNVRGSSSSSRSSNSSNSSSTYRTEAVAPLPPRTAVYRGNNPGGHRCVVADAPFPPLITLPWTIVRYGRASDQSQGGDCSAGCAANESADEGTKHQANTESSSTSSNSDSSNTSSNSNSSASSKSGIGSSSTSSSKAAHAGYRANESIEGAICLSFCAYYEVGKNCSFLTTKFANTIFLTRLREHPLSRLPITIFRSFCTVFTPSLNFL